MSRSSFGRPGMLVGLGPLWLLSLAGPTVGRFVCGSGAVYPADHGADLDERLRFDVEVDLCEWRSWEFGPGSTWEKPSS